MTKHIDEKRTQVVEMLVHSIDEYANGDIEMGELRMAIKWYNIHMSNIDKKGSIL